MFLSITRMVVPVLLMFLLGWFCHYRRIISAEGLKGIKDLVSGVLLPVVLFNAFFTAEYSEKIALTFGTVYVACALGLAAGFLLRRCAGKHGRFMPFLLTNFEGGMMGYALYGLLYPGRTHIFAMADIGQTLNAFTVFLITMQAVNSGKVHPGALAKNAVKNPALIGSLLGVILGATGIGKAVLASPAGGVVSDTISFIAAPVSGLILVIVGYELNFRKNLMKPVLVTAVLRIAVAAILLGLSSLLIFSIIPFDKQLFTALMLAWSLPAPFIIPLFADMDEDAEYISTTLSMETILSILLFIGVAAYSIA